MDESQPPPYLLIINDNDGKMSAGIARMLHPNAVVIPTYYGKPYPREKIPTGSKVIISGFSFPMDKMKEIAEKNTLYWFDHHYNAIEEAGSSGLECKGLQEEDGSGCELMYKYFFPDQPMPTTLINVGKYKRWDIFDSKDPLILFHGLNTENLYPGEKTFNQISQIIRNDYDMCTTIMTKGAVILDYLTKRDECIARDIAFTTEKDGHKFMAANIRGSNSLLFSGMITDSHKASIAFGYTPRYSSFRFSIYQNDLAFDVGDYARSHNGNGGTGAAGWGSDTICIPTPTPNLDVCKYEDHLASIKALHSNNVIRKYLALNDRISTAIMGRKRKLCGKYSFIVNNPFTWPELWDEVDTTGVSYGVNFVLTNTGYWRVIVHSLDGSPVDSVIEALNGKDVNGACWTYLTTDQMKEYKLI